MITSNCCWKIQPRMKQWRRQAIPMEMAWLAGELRIFSKLAIQIFDGEGDRPMPKLSVIVPVYNTEKYLRECVDSILAQTFTDFELILVDDGSTDGSGAICDDYAAKDPRIQVVHQQNGGATVARRSGVRIAQGEYVTFVDSDDWIDRDMYRIMLAWEPADVLICNMCQYTDAGFYKIKCYINPGIYDTQALMEKFYSTMLFDFEQCQPALPPSLCNKLFRADIVRKVIENVSDSITYGEDALCSYACILDAEQIYLTDQRLYYYRMNPESVSNVYNKKMFATLKALGKEMVRQVAERNRDMQSQVYGYLARNALEAIRNELLYHTDATLKEKRNRINRFIEDPLIRRSLCYAIAHIKDPKTKIKMILARYKMIGMLSLLYSDRIGVARK